MEELCKELDGVKAAMEKLKADYQEKSQQSESLRRAHNEQLMKIQEAKMEIEKQALELNAKREEISFVKEMYEGLKLNLKEKESVLKHLSCTNDQLRTSTGDKLQKLEKQNRDMVSTLNEANAKTGEQDQKISAYKEEIDRLKGLLFVSQKRCVEAEERAKVQKELREQDNLFLKLEEEKGKVEERLKWKNEQFKHLEEAHEKLQNQFRESKREWESEQSTLLDEVCSLQMNLESQVRVSEGLSSQLQMCNQALAHEESRRKLLELQVSESIASYENVVAEFQGAQSMIDSLTAKRDEEIATLRDLMATKENHLKEMEYIQVHLEQENKELHTSLKELQEAQISQAGGASTLMKLRQKLRGLEQAHRDCSSILKAKEAEWSSQTETLEKDLDKCQFELSSKEEKTKELQTELEGCHNLMMRLKSQNEEISTALAVLKSEFSQAHSELKNSEVEIVICNEKTERILLLTEQLEQKASALVKAQQEIKREHEMTASLTRNVESLDGMEQKYYMMQKDLEKYKKKLEESSKNLENFKEQASLKESALIEDLRKVSDALDKVNFDLAEKNHEGSENEFELLRWKSSVERMEVSKRDTENQLKSYRDETQRLRREMEAAIIAKMESEEAFKQEKEVLLRNESEKDKLVRGQIALLEESERRERETSVLAKEAEEEKEALLQYAEEKDKTIDNLKQQIVSLKEECARREIKEVLLRNESEKDKLVVDLRGQIALLEESERREREASVLAKEAEEEKEALLKYAEEKDKTIDNLKQQIVSLKEECARQETEAVIQVKNETQKIFEKERDGLLLIVKEKDKKVDELNKQIVQLENDSLKREKEVAIFATVEAEKLFNILLTVDEKEREIHDHRQCIMSLQKTLVDMECAKQSEANSLYKAWEKIATDWIIAKLEFHDQCLYIAEQEERIDDLKWKLELEEKSSFDSKQQLERLKGEVEMRQLERKKENDRLEEFEVERNYLLEVNAKLASERDGLVDQLIGFYNRIDGFLSEDMELMRSFERIAQMVENGDQTKGYGHLSATKDENICSPSKRKANLDSDNRLPLKDLNT